MKQAVIRSLMRRVEKPSTLEIGGRCWAGEWIPIAHMKRGGMIENLGRLAFRVTAEGSDWAEVLKKMEMK